MVRTLKPVLGTLLALALVSCAEKPADCDIERELREELSRNVPEKWMKAMVTGGSAQIDSIDIVEFGEFNEAGEFGPVRVEVSGNATLNVPFGARENRQFSEIAEIRMRKDDFGDWQGTLVRPSLFGS